MRRTLIVTITVALTATIVLAAEPYDPAARAKIVAPYLDEQTIAVGHVDLKRVDVDAIESLVLRMVRSAEPNASTTHPAMKEVAAAKKEASEWIASFTKAGGEDLYVVASMADLPERDKPFLIVPLGSGADAEAIAGLIRNGDVGAPTSRPADEQVSPPKMVCERLGHVLFAGPRETLERLRTLKPSPRPELAKAFETAGDTAAQVLLIPTADSRRVIEEMIPTLPEQIGGGSVTAVTRGVIWAAISIDTRPGVSARVVIQSQDAEAARSLDAVVGKIFERTAKEADVLALVPNVDKLLAALRPTVEGDRLKLALESGRLETLVGTTLSPAIVRAREQAKRTASLSNMRQILMGCFMYQADHKGQWPKDIQAVVAAKYMPAVVLNSPLQPGRKDAYVYIKPSKAAQKTPARSLVLFEAHDTWDEGVGVGFADGHVELVKDEKRFKELLANAKAEGDTPKETPPPAPEGPANTK